MNVLIIGAGDVGFNIMKRLSQEGLDISVIESDSLKIKRIKESCDVFVVQGNGDNPESLLEAGVNKADVVLAVTNSDSVNILSCYFSKILAPNCKTLARARNQAYDEYEYFFNKAHLNIDRLINPEVITAEMVLRLISIADACELSAFMEGKVKLIGFNVKEGAPIVGPNLDRFFKGKDRKDLLVVAIARNHQIIIPKGQTEVRVGDRIYFLTKNRGNDLIYEILGIKRKKLSDVMVIGGGTYGRFIARRLENDGINCKLIEKNFSKCQMLDQLLDDTVIIHGDGTEHELLHQENVEKMDLFVAVTGDGPLNLMAATIAKKIGVKRTLAMTYKQALFHLSHEMGIDIAILPQSAVTNAILQFVRRGKIVSVQTLGDEKAELVEFIASEDSPITGKPIKDIDLPKNTLVGIIEHEDEINIPTGEDIIYPGDRVVVFASEVQMPKVSEMLS